jgi:hypothetical protein
MKPLIAWGKNRRMIEPTERALEARARRAAKRIGLYATKSRASEGVDNHGGFMLVEPNRNLPVHGWRFELTAQDVIEYCEECTEAYFRHKSGKKEQLVKRALMRFLRELHCR